MLEVRLLDGLAAAVDGRPVALPADARARELLARLALAPGPQPRTALAGRLRPDVPDESARKTLRNALYELRRALGPEGAEALVVTAREVALADEVRVDVREFRRRLETGDLEGAVAAGRGELLVGFDGDWALRARDEHAAALAGVLGRLAERAEAAGDLPGAVAWARRRVEVEPLGEAAHREVIRLLAVGGDRPAALAAARAAADRLRAALGVAPSAATRALVEDVRRGTVAAAGAGAPVPAPPLPPALAGAGRPEGRAAALARLERAWAETANGAPRVAVVAGEPGIGKTTLAAELARRAHAQGGTVLLGRTDEHALVPFQPWVEALERLLDALGPAAAEPWLTAHGGVLARLLPARAAGAPAPEGDPRERYLAFELVRGLLEDEAARRPVLLVLDDVHWADAASLALLRHVARSPSRPRLLVLLCARPAELPPAATEVLAELRREAPLVHVELAGLDDDAVAAVLARHGRPADPATAHRLRVRSGGNPFFLDELVREAAEAGETAGAPAGVREVVGRRLARLGPGTREALDVAALCGLEFAADVVARVAERPLVAVLEALDPAAEAALVSAPDERGRCAFAHALVAEAIAGAQSPSRRARLHLRIADVLADGHTAGTAGAGEVARHLRGAGPLAAAERRVVWELTAADEATAALAHAEAAAHLEAALAAGPAGDDRERTAVLLALGDAHDRSGRRPAARAAFARAAALARAAPAPALLARAALGHGGVGVVIAAADPAVVALLEEALAAPPPGEPGTVARLLARLSVELYYADPERARALSARAIDRARDAGDDAALAAALNARRVALWRPHHADERLAVAGEVVAAAQAAGEREAELQGRGWRVVDLLELGRTAEAAAEVDAYAALADAVGLPHFAWYVPLWRGTLAMLAGRWAEADALADRALELGRAADDANAPVFVGIQRGSAGWYRTAAWDRERLVAGAAASAAPAEWLVNLALHDARTGQLDAARRRVAEIARDGARALGMDVNWHSVCVLAEAAVEVGDRNAGAAVAALLEPHARLFPLIARAVSCLGSAELHAGRVAGLLGRRDEAVARLRRAVAANDAAGMPVHGAYALRHLGAALAAAGEHDAARSALAEAAARAAALDVPVLARDVGRALAAPAPA